MNLLDGMTQQKWNALTPAQKEAIRDNSSLSPQLDGLEGWRVMVICDNGETRRFIVGKSTGRRPCHLEIKTARSHGGQPADRHYAVVRRIERVR